MNKEDTLARELVKQVLNLLIATTKEDSGSMLSIATSVYVSAIGHVLGEESEQNKYLILGSVERNTTIMKSKMLEQLGLGEEPGQFHVERDPK